MKDAPIPEIIFLLSVAVWCQQEQYHEVHLINRLNDFFGFDLNIFLLDCSTYHNRYISAKMDGNFIAQTVSIFDHNGTQLATLISLTSKNTFLIVAIDSLNFENSTQLWTKIKAIQRIDNNIKIGVFAERNITSTDVVEQLFRWSWSVGIVNIFFAFNSNVESAASSVSVFRYDPFDTFHLIDLTEIESLQNYFPDKVPNYRRYPLRFMHLNDVRRSYLETKLWDTVVGVFNASMLTISLSSKAFLESTVIVDVLSHEGTLTEIVQIYPHRMLTFLLMVPHAQPYPDFLAYLQNTTWKRLFAYTFIAIAGATLLLVISGYLRTKKILLVRCVADVINLLMNDNGYIRYGQLHRADVCIIVPLTFTGLIVVNGILSVFQSYLTVPIYEHQINTIDDLFKSPVPILANEIHWANRTIEILEVLSKHGGWSGKVHPTNMAQIMDEVMIFKNSIAFLVSDNRQAQIYLDVQKRLGLKAYHLISDILERSLITFPIENDFPYMEPINDVIHRLQCAGLMNKWLDDYDQLSIKRLWKFNLNRQVKPHNESDGAEFTIPTVVWCGWIASVILFACEIVWNKVKLKVKPHIIKIKTMFSMV